MQSACSHPDIQPRPIYSVHPFPTSIQVFLGPASNHPVSTPKPISFQNLFPLLPTPLYTVLSLAKIRDGRSFGLTWFFPLLFSSSRTLITVSTARRSAWVNLCFTPDAGFVVLVTGTAAGLTVEGVEEVEHAEEVESVPSRRRGDGRVSSTGSSTGPGSGAGGETTVAASSMGSFGGVFGFDGTNGSASTFRGFVGPSPQKEEGFALGMGKDLMRT